MAIITRGQHWKDLSTGTNGEVFVCYFLADLKTILYSEELKSSNHALRLTGNSSVPKISKLLSASFDSWASIQYQFNEEKLHFCQVCVSESLKLVTVIFSGRYYCKDFDNCVVERQ